MPGILDFLGPLTDIINKLIPDKTAAAQAAAALQQQVLNGQLQQEMQNLVAITTSQSEVDKQEAGNSNLFVAGWRPAVGWVCALALAFQYIARPLLGTGFTIAGHALPALPGLDDNLWQLMFGLLGMGSLRTFEKLKNVQSNH